MYDYAKFLLFSQTTRLTAAHDSIAKTVMEKEKRKR
jgi:hypothetical protein